MASSSTPVAAAATPMGALDKLSSELRCMIYDNCIINRSIGLLRASKELYVDIKASRLLRERFVLTFHIDPSESSSEVAILNQNGRTVNAGGLHADHSSIINSMPLDQFKRIEILIKAPDTTDPGQFVRAWKMTTGLVAALPPYWNHDMLEDGNMSRGTQTRNLPPIVVKFVETGTRSWTAPLSNGQRVLNHSVPDWRDWTYPTANPAAIGIQAQRASDAEILMTPFRRIRNAASLTVEPPPSVTDPSPADIQRACLVYDELARQQRPFGATLTLGVINDDGDLGAEDATHAWLDFLLDELAGPTAAMLRLERFASWCPEYDNQFSERLHGRPGASTPNGLLGGCAGDLPRNLANVMRSAYIDRFVAGKLHGEDMQGMKCDEVRRLRGETRTLDRIRLTQWCATARVNGVPARKVRLERVRELMRLSPRGHWHEFFPEGIKPKTGNARWLDHVAANITAWGFPFGVPFPQSRGDVTVIHAFGPIQCSTGASCVEDVSLDVDAGETWADYDDHRYQLKQYLNRRRPSAYQECKGILWDDFGEFGCMSVNEHVFEHCDLDEADEAVEGEVEW